MGKKICSKETQFKGYNYFETNINNYVQGDENMLGQNRQMNINWNVFSWMGTRKHLSIILVSGPVPAFSAPQQPGCSFWEGCSRDPHQFLGNMKLI